MRFTRAQTAWIALARKDAGEVTVEAYDEQRLSELAAALPRMVTAPKAFEELPKLSAEVGVALVHVNPLLGGRIDGVSLGLDDHPMIALSGRGKRLDKVLFALLHECAHVAMGTGGRPLASTRPEMSRSWATEAEEAVSGLAASWVFPRGLQVHGRPITKQVVANIAEEFGVAPSAVVGHLQHEGVIEWSSALSRGLPTVEEVLVTCLRTGWADCARRAINCRSSVASTVSPAATSRLASRSCRIVSSSERPRASPPAIRGPRRPRPRRWGPRSWSR